MRVHSRSEIVKYFQQVSYDVNIWCKYVCVYIYICVCDFPHIPAYKRPLNLVEKSFMIGGGGYVNVCGNGQKKSWKTVRSYFNLFRAELHRAEVGLVKTFPHKDLEGIQDSLCRHTCRNDIN